jgi:hypothetical protein
MSELPQSKDLFSRHPHLHLENIGHPPPTFNRYEGSIFNKSVTINYNKGRININF